MYKWVAVNCDGLASRPGGVAIYSGLAALCYTEIGVKRWPVESFISGFVNSVLLVAAFFMKKPFKLNC